MKSKLKQWIERLSGCRIYRDTLPHGTDLFKDMARVVPPETCRIVFDIGSHRGQSIVDYLSAFPHAQIHGFEPSNESFQALEDMFRLEPRVQVHRTAISNNDGEAVLYLKPADSTHSLIQETNSVGSERVKILTLDSVCSAGDLRQIDFCKIDTEGNDLNVLRGATELLRHQRISFVQVETSTRQDVTYFCRLQEIEQFLAGFGYELFGFYDQQPCWSGRHSLLYFNAVFISSALVGPMPPM